MVEGITLPESYNLIEHQSLASTNDEALDIAGSVPDKTIIWAREQTAARGRRGRTWHAPPGNLYCSIILKPNMPILECSQLGYVAALAIFDTVNEICPNDSSVACKWPNDVLLGDKKVSGILLETSLSSNNNPDWIVLGVGINVITHPDDTPYPATDLVSAGAKQASVELTLERFIHNFNHWLGVWTQRGFAPLRKKWLSRAAGLQKKIIVRLENQELSGIFKGIDSTGALILHQNSKEKESIISAGDIFFPNLTD